MQRLERHASLYGELASELKASDGASDRGSHHERTPLLRRVSTASKFRRHGATPLPKLQLSVILFIQLSEPVTSQCIYPFIVELIRSLDVTHGDTRKVGYYAGLIESLFFLAEALTVIFWTRLSDFIGRKPVLFICFCGTTISMILFGLSQTFLHILLSRCLAGLMNGNSGVLKSMMGEITDPTNMAQAFAFMPMVWFVGSTTGAFIGGTLSDPYDRISESFKSLFWRKYPYFLPCLVVAMFPALACLVVLLVLKETAPAKSMSPIRPLDDASDRASISSIYSYQAVTRDQEEDGPPPSIKEILNRRVITAVLNYAFLSLVDISYICIEPLFYATEIENGGLGLDPQRIGICMGCYGVLVGVCQIFFFPIFHNWLGSKRLLILTLCTNFPIFALFPIINYSAKASGLSFTTWLTVGVQITLCAFSDMSGGCAFIFLTLSAPNKRSLGTTNGLAAAATAAIRSIGPAFVTTIFAFTVENHTLHGLFVYIILLVFVIIALTAAYFLPDNEHEWEEEAI